MLLLLSEAAKLQVTSHTRRVDQHLIETTQTSSTKSSSFGSGGFFLGIILICFAFPLLWNNERKKVKVTRLIDQGRRDCQAADYQKPSAADDHRLVHVSGLTENDEVIADREFAVEASNAVKLVRRVEMYQWIETTTQKGNDRREYEYHKEWRECVVDSEMFDQRASHPNPRSMPFQSSTMSGKDTLKFGGYVLADSQIDLLLTETPMVLTQEQLVRAQNATEQLLIEQNYTKLTQEGSILIVRGKQRPFGEYGFNSFAVGDIKITFSMVKCGPTSIIAQQVPLNEGDDEKIGKYTFRAWNPMKVKDENNSVYNERVCMLCACCPCAICVDYLFSQGIPETIHEVQEQPLKAEDMFKALDEANSLRTTLFRLLGWFLLYLGIYLLFSPVISLVSWIPLVGFLFAHGVSFIAGILALVLSVLLTVLTISVAWLYYRPLLGLGLITLVGVASGLLLFGGTYGSNTV